VLLEDGVNRQAVPGGRLDKPSGSNGRLLRFTASRKTLWKLNNIATVGVDQSVGSALADGSMSGLRVDVTELSHAKDAAEAPSKARQILWGA